MSEPPPTGIVRAAEGDRPRLASLSPKWFDRHVLDQAWMAVSEGRVEAAAMLASRGRTGISLELAAVSDEAGARWGRSLIGVAVSEAEAWGGDFLETEPGSQASSCHAPGLEEAGFSIHETVDDFNIELAALLGPTRALRDRMKGLVASRIRPEIIEVDARHIDAVATAWSLWIGGNVGRSIERMRSRFNASSAADPLRRLQLVAVADDAVVGFACGHLASPTVLHIDAEAVDPAHRLDPFFMTLKTRFYENAAEAGAERATFTAGSGQPDTRTLARRFGVEPVRSRPRFRLDLAGRRENRATGG
ncbi:MAG: hypothetical protein P8J88_13795 [Phycisphaerales bacterium]|nr:hypothetical protein [Phycisphaerales bacterium]MDG1978963.1 hypothetical protein [Phycisphaerales bacterium]MDG2134551.1 hypothetical protein [Phycisphaerales bacterium]